MATATSLRERVAVRLCHEDGKGFWASNPQFIPEGYWRQADAIIDSIREGMAEAWDQGYRSGKSRAMRMMSDEPGLRDAENPYAVKRSSDE